MVAGRERASPAKRLRDRARCLQGGAAAVADGGDPDLDRLRLRRLEQEPPSVCCRHGATVLMRLGGPAPSVGLGRLGDGAGERGPRADLQALAVQLDLPPLLQDGGAGLVAGGLLQAAAQVAWRRLDDGGLQQAAVRQPLGRRARRADDGLEVVELLGDAVVALGADGALGALRRR